MPRSCASWARYRAGFEEDQFHHRDTEDTEKSRSVSSVSLWFQGSSPSSIVRESSSLGGSLMRGFLLASLFVVLCASMQAQMLCESPQGGYRECRVGSAGVLALVGELSEGRCV